MKLVKTLRKTLRKLYLIIVMYIFIAFIWVRGKWVSHKKIILTIIFATCLACACISKLGLAFNWCTPSHAVSSSKKVN